MIYDSSNGKLTLASGRVIWTHDGILGIDNRGLITEGWDNYIAARDAADNVLPLTPEERREIAEEMIARWAKFGGMTHLPKG